MSQIIQKEAGTGPGSQRNQTCQGKSDRHSARGSLDDGEVARRPDAKSQGVDKPGHPAALPRQHLMTESNL